MTILYHLVHEYVMENGEDEIKNLGVYSTRERAQEAITRYWTLPGFRDHPDGFKVYESELDRDGGWTEGFVRGDPYALPSDPIEDDLGEMGKKH